MPEPRRYTSPRTFAAREPLVPPEEHPARYSSPHGERRRRYTPAPAKIAPVAPATSASQAPLPPEAAPLFTNRDLSDPLGAAERAAGRRRYSPMPDPNATLDRALDVVFGLEGGYADHPADRGGRTIYGISERAYPHLWEKGVPTKAQAAEAYRDLWESSGAAKVASLGAPGSDRLAMALFDAAVHHGPQRAAILLQRAAGAGLRQDGNVGPVTLEQVEARLRHDARGKSLVGDLAKERLRFFNRIVRNDPSQRVFLAGWNERLVKLHDQLR
jgi:hypothetical protein